LPILFRQLLKFTNPLIERQGVQRRHSYGAAQPIRGFTVREIEVPVALGERCLESPLRQFRVDGFEGAGMRTLDG
jgi:hypothetical protein